MMRNCPKFTALPETLLSYYYIYIAVCTRDAMTSVYMRSIVLVRLLIRKASSSFGQQLGLSSNTTPRVDGLLLLLLWIPLMKLEFIEALCCVLGCLGFPRNCLDSSSSFFFIRSTQHVHVRVNLSVVSSCRLCAGLGRDCEAVSVGVYIDADRQLPPDVYPGTVHHLEEIRNQPIELHQSTGKQESRPI